MMENKIVFGPWEAAAILINAIIVQVILNFPRSMVEVGGNAGWIVSIYISILAFLGFYLIQKLYTKFEGKDLLDIGEYIGGDILRVIMGILLMAHLIFAAAIILREFSEDMKVISLNVTPISVVTAFFISGMIAAAYLGIESIVRFTAIHVPIVILAYIIIIILAIPYCDITNIFPILGTGVKDLFGKGFFRISSYSALILIILCFPFIKTKGNFKTAGYIGIGVSAFMLISSSLVYILVFRYGYALENFLPIFEISRLIKYSGFFQRIESVFVLAWALVAFMYLSTVFFFAIHVFKKTFKLKYYRPLIPPFAVLIFTLSLAPTNLMDTIELENALFRNYAWITPFVITAVLLAIAKAIKKRKDKKEVRA
ncbi:MAG: endospore germination permease [Bacillota bacterium]|nr:endospore germination permease [Bacillota bacterium]